MLPPISEHAKFEPALGCQDCFVREQCGGLYIPEAIDCLRHCCNKPDRCTYLCPHNKNFLRIWRDTNGIDITIDELRQTTARPPAYVPLIQHGSNRVRPLDVPFVALTTFDVTRRDRRKSDMNRDPDALRDNLRLDRNASILLCSVAPDHELERYWVQRKDRALIEGIRSIRPAHVIAPNFSLFRDVPRPDNLANIKRSILCAEEFSKAGLSVIPYVMGITDRDWQRWADFLKEHKTIQMVGKEFQTGGKRQRVGEWHIQRLLELQERLGRSLHLVAIGGRRYSMLRRFPWKVTIIDSVPFMRTMHRRQLTTNGWQVTLMPKKAPLDDLLHHNITAYAESCEMNRPRISIQKRPVRAALDASPQLNLQFGTQFESPNAA